MPAVDPSTVGEVATLIGLPGNPVAALVAYEVIVRQVLSGRQPTV